MAETLEESIERRKLETARLDRETTEWLARKQAPKGERRRAKKARQKARAAENRKTSSMEQELAKLPARTLPNKPVPPDDGTTPWD